MQLDHVVTGFVSVIGAAIILSLVLAPDSQASGVIGAASKFFYNTINSAKAYPGTGGQGFQA